MKDLNKLYLECKNEMDMLGIYYDKLTPISWYNAKSNWGRCSRKGKHFSIEISKKLASDDVSDKATKTTILHEMIHTVDMCNNHGSRFRFYANKLNEAYGYNIKRISTHEEKGIDRRLGKDYDVQCTGCGANWYMKSTQKFIKLKGVGYKCRCGCNKFKINKINLGE